VSPLALLVPIAFAVGASIGAVGVGGILLIPALQAIAGLDIHVAMATALFTFIFTGVVGTWLFQRKGSIDWRMTRPVCWGAAVFAFTGAWMSSRTQPAVLALILATLILLAGAYTLVGMRAGARTQEKGAARTALLGAVGCATGLGSGLTGVGGPAVSVPLMVVLGFPARASVGTGQVIQIVAALTGTLGNLRYGAIDFGIALPVGVAEIAGVVTGVRIAHAIDARALRRFVGALCIAVAAFVFVRALGAP
jgi:uncharacterized membrane protein YfcA